MKNIIFYKIKKSNNHWIVAFLKEDNEELTTIKDDVESLKRYLKANRDSVLVGANNYVYDDILLTSLVKDNNLTGEVTSDDITSLLPVTLDITQGIVRNSLIDYNNMVCSIWDSEGQILPYKYAINEDGITKQLVEDLEIIKSFYSNEERKRFLDWKMSVVEEFNLPKKAYHYSYGDIMREILGLRIDDDNRVTRKLTLDSRLSKALKERNDPFLNRLLKKLEDYYSSDDNLDKLTIKIDDCLVKFNEQGILGSIEKDYIDTDPNSEYTYLYIDFNSFGPNILINNNWLDKVARHPEKYSEIKDRRIKLKSEKNIEQLYYKYLLNSGLDYLNRVRTKNNENVGLSLTMSGIMTMMLLYRNIEQYDATLIECNTDGFIVKCPKNTRALIEEEALNLAEKLFLSCDVDEVTKIAHFGTADYVMEFADGSQKHLGDFGVFQTHPLYCSGIEAVETALRKYYMDGVPVSITLRNLRNENNLKAFQIVKKQKKNEKPKYVKDGNEYSLYDRSSSRLFAVRKEEVKNPFYVSNNKGGYEEYKVKRGRSVKDGYFYFELADETLPDIHDIDLTYYINECYKVIDKHPMINRVQFMSDLPKRNCFIDLDGTITKEKGQIEDYRIFREATDGLLKENDLEIAYQLFSDRKGGYLIQFLGLCKKFKGYGTVDNLAEFLMSKNLFPGRDLKDYKHFVTSYLNKDKDYSSKLESYDGSKDLLEYLNSEGYNTILYSNWFKKVQESKLDSHGFLPYFKDLCTIDDYYAKSSVKGWEDVLASQDVSTDDFNIMIGNGTNDLVPKSIGIPSIIVNHSGKPAGKTVSERGIIVNSFQEVTNTNFKKEIEDIKALTKKRTK